jgi:L-alanine-DL-glutamate epimerase-like enolase superfamily enzyme
LRISNINVYRLLLPFSDEFSHSLRKRKFVKNIIVEIIADHRKINGYGEGAPRSYVTGEMQKNAANEIKDLIEIYPFPWELNNVTQIWGFVDSLPKEKQYNSAICALEIGLLDALARKENRPIIDYFSTEFLADTIHYGAAIPLSSKKRITEVCGVIKGLEINKLRLKMGKDLKENTEMFETVRRFFGEDCDLRIDVNGAWNRELAFAHIPLIKKNKVKVVEQPFSPDNPDISEFADEMQKGGVIMMADELACTKTDVKRIINDGHYKMINVRLSKCGGIRRSLDIIELIRSKGISFQIGCQLGESGILSAAGRALCLLCRDAVYYDGSYDAYLLKENITTKDVFFGVGGKAGPLEGPGLGVEVNRKALERLSDPDTITIKNPNRYGAHI